GRNEGKVVQIDKRGNLVRAAGALFHRRGFEHTSLADITSDAGLPGGNVYYDVNTPDHQHTSVTEKRIAAMRERPEQLTSLSSPQERILAYMAGWEAHTQDLTAHGCPVGGLCLETSKQGGEAAETAASVLKDTLDWFGAQFRAMGYREKEARDLAAKLMGARH